MRISDWSSDVCSSYLVADDGGPRLAIEAGGGPEGEEAEGGDYRRQQEGRHAQCLEHARPGRPAPPQEPGERHGDDHREGGRERREADRGEARATPAVVGEKPAIPVPPTTFPPKQQPTPPVHPTPH